MQIVLLFLKTYTRLNQNEVKEPKTKYFIWEHSKSLIKKGSWITNFALYSKCTFRKYFNKLQSLKKKKKPKSLQLIAWIQFPGNNASERNKQKPVVLLNCRDS